MITRFLLCFGNFYGFGWVHVLLSAVNILSRRPARPEQPQTEGSDIRYSTRYYVLKVENIIENKLLD